MNRSIIKRIPGRLVFNGVSLYSKEGTTIAQELQYTQVKIGAAGLGDVDNRDDEAHYKITITPDGRISPTLAAVLWPYANATIGAGIFSDIDVPAQIHGNDNSLDTYVSVAVNGNMPQMIFHPTKTLVGELELLALRANNLNWIDANSLLTEADTGGTFVDANFSRTNIITQDYQLTWGNVTGFASLDFVDGLTFEPRVEYVDDTVAPHGLFNRHIKNVGGIVRGIPLGPTRQQIQTQLKIQGAGAGRGTSGAAKAFPLDIIGADGKTYLHFDLAQLVQSKKEHGVEQLRVGEVAWELIPALTNGARGPFFTTPIA